ncbi:class I mannose-6-phosphate isomerase [Kineosporia sp. NBRC 101731]|uniref:class I mannose-6-phosphate isomerase n=1 Tax=Kineosporia sp. NBRC 101731 TaxID=3032199 RepID=UPI0024A0BFA0|nr:class I mannose-6-phosphate isomerase [Kineosporia sp. NBRC 101731]GLY29387.1 mannose-6-phosphate isomerase [Kineosporia sp. NBRC 101731]
MDVVELSSNRPPERFYRGGAGIVSFRGEPGPAPAREPEDWVASTTSLFGEPTRGRSTLPDGRSLAAAVTADPLGWLGPAHVDTFGADTKLLVKLLDAGQRLPVHAHPHRSFAATHLGRSHGKAEAWYILSGGVVHLGLCEDIPAHELAALVQEQDTEALLGLLHRIEVHRGDVVYVPPGVLHAIGEGVFLVEVQEPEDLSILLEWKGFELDGARDGHLGLGFGVALAAVERTARTIEEIALLVGPAGVGPQVLPVAAGEYFVLERVSVAGSAVLRSGFGVLVVLSGSVQVRPAAGAVTRLAAGTTTVVPYAAGALQVAGEAELLMCRPPS